LEAARARVPEAHITCLSSGEVYGSSPQPLAEDDPLRPLTPYGAAKAAMEVLCDQHTRAHGTRIAIVRPFNQIGPGLAPGHAIADFTAAVAAAERHGEPGAQLAVGHPAAARDYTDIRDCAGALLTLAREEVVGTFNLCSGRSTTIAELIEQLAGIAAIPVTYEVDPALARPADPAVKIGRPDRLTAATGWQPTIPLPQTLAEMLAAARGQE
ncbi:MAG TPA: GDP-mannose 4,6-dehydratase, partial [Solirubrobacterales bacterium]|nr:GDP-mannose 4,6-dehydratase [Solirubrobacterales bacterium]